MAQSDFEEVCTRVARSGKCQRDWVARWECKEEVECWGKKKVSRAKGPCDRNYLMNNSPP